MAFRSSQLDSMTGAGAGTTNNSLQFNLNARKNIPDPTSGARKNIGMVGLPQQNKQRKMGFFDVSGDDDNETSQYLNQTVFKPEKEMSHSQSPSQLFGSNFCSQAIPILPRNVSGSQFPPRNNPGHITPTSINPNFPISMQQQQQHSPNSLSAIGPRSVLGQNQTQQQAIGNLQKRTTLPSAFGSAGPITSIANNFGFPGSRQVGLVSKPVQEQTPEFNITAEEFPALPGSTNPPSSAANDSGRKTVSALFGPPNPYMPAPGGGAFDPSANKDAKNGDKSSQPKRGIQTHQDGTVSNIPSGMVTDQFGIVGLLTFIRAAENDHNLVALAPGIDLTTLGLNLNSPEYVRNLYSTFQSPWADAPCRPQDIDFHVPAEYLTNIFIRDKLAPIKLNRYGEDLLFFLFYMNGGDVLQLAAAAELYNRDWRYHKEERVWMTRAPGMEPLVKTNTYERGTYYFFDAQNWRKVAKEFLLEYDKLEERPTLPPTLHHNPNQPIVSH